MLDETRKRIFRETWEDNATRFFIKAVVYSKSFSVMPRPHYCISYNETWGDNSIRIFKTQNHIMLWKTTFYLIQWDMGDNSIQFFIIIFFTQNHFLWCKGHINLFPSSETWEITLHQILQQILFTLNHFLLWRNHIILISYCETWEVTPSALVQTSKSFFVMKNHFIETWADNAIRFFIT